MDITPLIPEGRQIIQSYGAKGFKISGTEYEGPVIVTPFQTRIWKAASNIIHLTAAHIENERALMEEMDVILLGTGKTSQFPPDEVYKAFPRAPEIMETGAACRTYNVLVAEDRRVAAVLLNAQ